MVLNMYQSFYDQVVMNLVSFTLHCMMGLCCLSVVNGSCYGCGMVAIYGVFGACCHMPLTILLCIDFMPKGISCEGKISHESSLSSLSFWVVMVLDRDKWSLTVDTNKDFVPKYLSWDKVVFLSFILFSANGLFWGLLDWFVDILEGFVEVIYVFVSRVTVFLL